MCDRSSSSSENKIKPMWTGLIEANAFPSIVVIQIYFLPNARQPNIPSQLGMKKKNKAGNFLASLSLGSLRHILDTITKSNGGHEIPFKPSDATILGGHLH